MSRSILYYPSINIQDGTWLRNAVLYWDEVCSIVPDQYNPIYSKEISCLIERNIYRPVYPSNLFYSNENDLFSKDVIGKIKRLKLNKNPVLVNSEKINMRKIEIPQLRELIHYKKIPLELYDFLTEKKLLHKSKDSNWLEMEEHTADIYMSSLAKYLAKIDDEDMVIGTDKNKSLYTAFSTQFPNDKRLCLTTIFEKAMPVPNLDVGIERLIRFRQKRRDELLHIRVKLRDFENNLSQVTSIEELKSIIQEFRDNWELELIEMDKLMKDHTITYHFGNFKSLIEICGGAASLMQALYSYCNGFPSWIFVAGLSIAGLIGVGTNYLNYKADLKQKRNNYGFAYLYSGIKKGIMRKVGFMETI